MEFGILPTSSRLAMVASYPCHPPTFGVLIVGLWTKRPTVLSQAGLPPSKRKEFFKSEGPGFHGVVHGMGTRQACQRARLMVRWISEVLLGEPFYPPPPYGFISTCFHDRCSDLYVVPILFASNVFSCFGACLNSHPCRSRTGTTEWLQMKERESTKPWLLHRPLPNPRDS